METLQKVQLNRFKNYTIYYFKSEPREYSEKNGRMEYYSKGQKDIYIKTNSNNDIRILIYDERGFNDMQITILNIKINKKYYDIAIYIYDMFLKLKQSNPDYGTYSQTNRNWQCEGRKNLYLHEIFEYIYKQERFNKLKSIFDDFK